MRANKLKEIWARGRPATNCWTGIPAAMIAEALSHQGWDSITIDMQHGHLDWNAAYQMLTAISTTACVPLVRVAWNAPGDVMRALDGGAYGVICPNVETAEECQSFVGACLYAPSGYRSVGPRRAMLYGGEDYIECANDTVLRIVQVETAKGLDNVDAIASVPGLDMIYVGPNDLGLSLGRQARSDQTDPIVVAAIDRILNAAKTRHLRAGIWCRSVAYSKAMIEKGFDLVTVTSDGDLLASGSALAAQFR